MILRSKKFTYNRAINHVGEEKRTKTEIFSWRLKQFISSNTNLNFQNVG